MNPNSKTTNCYSRLCPSLAFIYLLVITSSLNAQDCGPYPDWETSEYVLPYPVGRSYKVWQGNCFGGHLVNLDGAFIHSYDFEMPIGTTVVAARSGVVVATRTQFRDGNGGGGGFVTDNNIIILHDDGSYAGYGHFTFGGVLVQIGEVVRQGQIIGKSGNTGETGGVPHLHLHITECSGANLPCANVYTSAFTFRNTRANPDGLQTNGFYRAEEYVSEPEVVLAGAGHVPEICQSLDSFDKERYSQVLLIGSFLTLAAVSGEVTRMLYLDFNDDIVYVELAGDGTLTLELDGFALGDRAFPDKYDIPIRYSKGHARLSIEGATEDTYLSMYALGPLNGEDPLLFPSGEVYDGRVDLKSIHISGMGMGGLYLGNASFSGSSGLVGIDATGVPIHGRVAIGGISAHGSGEPALLFGEGSTLAWDDGAVLVASTALEQPNGSSIRTSGFESMLSIASRDSNGSVLSAKVVEAGFEDTKGEVVDIALSLDADQSEAKLSAPFVSELLGGGFGGSPQLSLVADQTYGKQAIVLSATAPSSRVPLQLSVASGHARINGDTLSLTGVGNVVVRATLPKTAFSEVVIVEHSFEVLEIADPYGDPDGDGIASIAETALGMDASVSDREELPAFSSEGSRMLVSFKRNRTDFQYVVEASEDLETWSDEDVVFEELGGVTRAEAPTLGGSESRRFLRLRVEK